MNRKTQQETLKPTTITAGGATETLIDKDSKSTSVDTSHDTLKDNRPEGSFDKQEKLLLALFLVCFSFMFAVIYFFPSLSAEDKDKLIRFPKGADDLRLINSVIQKLTEQHFGHVTLAFCSLYIFLQTFAIPGPIFLSVLSGAIFGGVPGFLMVCLCATTGASLCYTLSWLLGRNLVKKYFNKRLIQLQSQLEKQKDNLIFYLLFLRITPIVPNFFINISSPVLNVPLSKFFLATLFGLMPMNIIHVKTGLMLHDIQQVGVDFKTIIMLFGLGFLALLPTLFKKKLESQYN